ncbi:unnamed protein product [Ectocarpus sp. CCAP 1310/34]|nr:unnamed protein product [Ectocarpus sp. CCAP 1310/34]
MGSVYRALPPLEGNRRCRPQDEFGSSRENVPPRSIIVSGSGDALSDLHTKLAHIQWRRHANDKSIRKALETTKRLQERDMMLQLSVDREGETKLHLKSLKRVERTVTSKKCSAITAQRPESRDAEGRGGGERALEQQEDDEALKERLRRVRVGVKEKRRELRRSASYSKDQRGTFSATGFKTGRGRC